MQVHESLDLSAMAITTFICPAPLVVSLTAVGQIQTLKTEISTMMENHKAEILKVLAAEPCTCHIHAIYMPYTCLVHALTMHYT